MRAAALYLRLTRRRRYASPERARRALEAAKDDPAPPAELVRRFDVRCETVDEFDVYTVRSRDAGGQANPSNSGAVIYLHGGAFVNEIQPQHWSLIGHVAEETDADVCVPIYGLAPSYHADDAIRLMHRVIADLSESGPIYLIGDSAGGGLALTSTLLWQQDGGAPPRGLTLIAPWLDLGLRNPDIAAIEPSDPWLVRPGLHVCAKAWAADIAHDDPRVSPLFGDLESVPPIDLYVGTRDITVADCRLLRDRLPGRVTYHEEPGAVHVYPLLPVPEGKAARRELVAHVKSVMT
jgi:acetyl esterase/lipase